MRHDADLEPWPSFLKRATRIAEDMIDKLGIEKWTVAQQKRKWRWASRVAHQTQDRWAHLVSKCQPEVHEKRCRGRRQARPRKRWDDDIAAFLATYPRNDDNDDDNDNNDGPPTENDDDKDGNATNDNAGLRSSNTYSAHWLEHAFKKS